MRAFTDSAVSGELPSVPGLPLLNRRVVALGGGKGLSTLLRGLRSICFAPGEESLSPAQRQRLTAIVTVADDGGSSGVLRRAYSILAPGDIRNCLLALAASDRTLQSLFDFRFDGKVDGHSLGNLILTALAQLESDFVRAVERAGDLLNTCGRVLPATDHDISLEAEFTDGSVMRGESRIAGVGRPIRRIRLVPPGACILPQTLDALTRADLVVIGPGSLYTSLIPNLLVPGVAEAIAASGATVILVMNLMTEPGETEGYGPRDFLRALRRHAPQLPVHWTLVNDAAIDSARLQAYADGGSVPVAMDAAEAAALGSRVLACDLLDEGGRIRHAPHKLARAILAVAGEPGIAPALLHGREREADNAITTVSGR